MSGGGGSVVVRRELGRKLRELRIGAGKSIADVVEAGVGSTATIYRVEAGKVPVKVTTIRTLCWLYGADAPTTNSLAAMAPGTQVEGWWEDYGVPQFFRLYIGLEQTAARLRCWQPEWVHGLVQTEQYARAVIESEDTLTPDVVDQRVRVRLDRQRRVLGRRSDVTVVLGAGALSLVVGSPDIMVAQLDHLRRLDRDGVAIVRVLPWSAGAYPMQGSFALLDFDDEDDPSVAYVESSVGAKYLELSAERQPYEHVFELLVDRSVRIEEWKR